MKILFNVKDSPNTNSAYGKIAYYLIPYLTKHHNLTILAPVGLQYTKLNYEGATIYGQLGENLTGENVALELYRRNNCDFYLTLPEVWFLPYSHEWSGKGWIYWIPFNTQDFENMPQFLIERLSRALAVIPTYRKNESILKRAGLENILPFTYYCGVDTSLYIPLANSKEEIYTQFPLTRRSIGGDSDFIISIIAMNSRRKNWEEQLRIVKHFQEENPDLRIGIYCHTQPVVNMEYDLRLLIKELELKNVKFADTITLSYGYKEEEMVRILNCSDVILSLTGGESGDFPLVEGMAVGTPCIAIDYTINSELLEPFPELLVDVKSHYYTSNPSLLKALPDEDEAVETLNYVMNTNPDKYLKSLPKEAEKFDWSKIAEGVLDRLERVEDLIEERCLRIPEPSRRLKERSEIIS